MVNTLTLEKDKDSGIKFESATPAVDHPDVEVDQREVRQRCCCHFTMLTLVHSCHASPFISPNKKIRIYNKRGIIKGEIQYKQRNEGTKFPKD
jgi:hypothetical protein